MSHRTLAICLLVMAVASRSLAGAPRSLGVTVLGSPSDSRVIALEEAVVFWNRELGRIGAQVTVGPVRVVNARIPDEVLRELSASVMDGRGARGLRRLIDQTPGEIVVALSQADLVSFGIEWHPGGKGFVALRRADVTPLSLPNVARNAIAHELGHVLGLPHNDDPATLMCGRPAACRPSTFASDTARFFPLTASDDRDLRDLWP